MGILLRGGVLAEPREFKHMAVEKTENTKSRSTEKLLTLHQWPRLLVIAGVYGCGKTEWLLSLASALAQPETQVYLSDLTDERSFLHDRAIAIQIKRMMPDVHVIFAGDDGDVYGSAVIEQQIKWALGREDGYVLLDVGINASALSVLRKFKNDFLERGYDFHLVVNPFNPQTADAENVMALKLYQEEVSGFLVTGLIANAFGKEGIDPRSSAQGSMSVYSIAQELNLPFLYALANEDIAEMVSMLLPEELPVWSLTRILRNEEEGA